MISSERYKSISNEFKGKRIFILGDLMLDRYYYGQSSRMSPEAPVPVVDIQKIKESPGGASNVALNLSSLGAHSVLCGLIGDDVDGEMLINSLKSHNISIEGLIKDPSRPTTVKSRIISKDHQVLRMDLENSEDTTPEINSSVLDTVSNSLSNVDAIILQDYNKGLLNEITIKNILSLADEKDIPVYVDPKHRNFSSYQNVRMFKPNLSEFYSYMPQNQDIESAGFSFIDEIKCDILMVTRSADGISLFYNSEHHHIPTKARSIHDVSGAGDTVIAVYCLSEISGANPLESALIANHAAGRVCEKVGVVPITLSLLDDILN